MIDGAPTHTTLPCSDLQRARLFYSEKLGLEPSTETPAGLVYETGGSRFFLFPSQGKPSGAHTQMGFRVADIDATVKDLRRRGVDSRTTTSLGSIRRPASPRQATSAPRGSRTARATSWGSSSSPERSRPVSRPGSSP